MGFPSLTTFLMTSLGDYMQWVYQDLTVNLGILINWCVLLLSYLSAVFLSLSCGKYLEVVLWFFFFQLTIFIEAICKRTFTASYSKSYFVIDIIQVHIPNNIYTCICDTQLLQSIFYRYKIQILYLWQCIYQHQQHYIIYSTIHPIQDLFS